MKNIILIIVVAFIHVGVVFSEEDSLVKEDFVGDWRGEINGENIELAIWFTKKGLYGALGGYVLLPDSNCIQQFGYSEPSENLWKYAKNDTAPGALTKTEYFNSYRLLTSHPSWLDKTNSCAESNVIKNMNGIFSTSIFIKEFGKSVILSYVLTTDRDNDNKKKRDQEIKYNKDKNSKENKILALNKAKNYRMKNIKIGKLRRALKNNKSPQERKKIELEIESLQALSISSNAAKPSKFVYKSQTYKVVLSRGVLSSTMLGLAMEKRHYGSHPKPTEDELAILQSTDG